MPIKYQTPATDLIIIIGVRTWIEWRQIDWFDVYRLERALIHKMKRSAINMWEIERMCCSFDSTKWISISTDSILNKRFIYNESSTSCVAYILYNLPKLTFTSKQCIKIHEISCISHAIHNFNGVFGLIFGNVSFFSS